MSATSFGGSFELTRTDDGKTRGIFQRALINLALNTQFPFLRYIPYAPSRTSPEIDEMIEQIISKRRKALDAGEERKDLLQIFLDTHDANPSEFTVEHIYEEMRLFMFVFTILTLVSYSHHLFTITRIAGSDTTSATAIFTVLLILKAPSKLKLLIAEIDAAFKNTDHEITFAATQNLCYLNACINESMRLMPIVTGIPRVTERAIVLDGFKIPAGVCI